LQTRKFKKLLESNLGWEFQQNNAVDGLYFDENDEVGVYKLFHFVLCEFVFMRLNQSSYWLFILQFAPVVEMLDGEAHAV